MFWEKNENPSVKFFTLPLKVISPLKNNIDIKIEYFKT